MSAPPTNCSFGICLPLMGSLLAALPLMAEIPFAAAVIRDGSRYLLQVPARPGELYCLEVPDVPGSMSFTSVPGTAVYAQSSTVSWPLELPGTVVLDQSAGTPSGEEPPAVGGSTLLVLTVEVADPPGSHVRLRAGGANPWTAVAPAAFPRVTFDGFADLPTANGVRCTALSARTLPEPIGESEPGRAQLSPEQQQEFDAVMAAFPQLIAAATLPPGLPPASGTPPTSPLTSSRYFRVAMYRVDTNGNGYADADELAIGSNPFARPGEPGFLPAASSADGTATPGIAPIWDTDGDFSPDFEEIAAGTSPLLKYSAPVVLTCQKLDRWAIFNSAGSWREYEERFHGWEPGWRNPIHPEMLSGSPISMDPATTPRTLSGFMSDFAAGWSEFAVPSPDARKGLPPQSLFGEYWKLPPLIARSVSPGAGNPPATNGYIRAIGDRYRLRGPLSQVTQQRQFIKATWTQTEGFNQSQVPEYAAETLMEQPPASTEVITLTIPAGALYSPPYDVTPDAPDTPHTNVSDYLKVVRLLPIDIEEVISDQIAGNEANKLPSPYFGGNPAKPENGYPNNPMLMATRTGQKAKLRVKMATTDAKIFVGARKTGTQTILGSASCATSPVPLEFDVPATSHDIYEVVAGYDKNGNATLDDAEAKVVFEKTPRKDKEGNTATANLHLIDKIIVVDQGQFNSSKSTVIGYNTVGTEYAGDLIEGFARGSKTIPNASIAYGITLSSTEPGLSHPLGGKWNATHQSPTYRFTFTNGSPASNDVKSSEALKQIVQKIINDNKAAMISAYTGSPEWPVSPYYNFSEDKDLITTEAEWIGINELGNAFGKVTFEGKLRVSYKKTSATTIQVGSVEVIGSFDDLYDFAYGGGTRARQAAMVQAGHATLAPTAEPDGGKVFFTRVEFNTGFANTWNGTY